MVVKRKQEWPYAFQTKGFKPKAIKSDKEGDYSDKEINSSGDIII